MSVRQKTPIYSWNCATRARADVLAPFRLSGCRRAWSYRREAPGAGDWELGETAAADLTFKQQMLLSSMYRHDLVAETEDTSDRQGPGNRTLLTEPPSLDYQELAVLGLIEIEGAGANRTKPQWLAMLTPAGRLRAHRIAVALLGKLENDYEGHPS